MYQDQLPLHIYIYLSDNHVSVSDISFYLSHNHIENLFPLSTCLLVLNFLHVILVYMVLDLSQSLGR